MNNYFPKHFVFILNIPSKDKCLMWPGYYEDHKDEIEKDYEEVLDYDISKQIGYHASFMKGDHPHKVFTAKVKQNKQI